VALNAVRHVEREGVQKFHGRVAYDGIAESRATRVAIVAASHRRNGVLFVNGQVSNRTDGGLGLRARKILQCSANVCVRIKH
jgi:hypothetical protein